MTTPNTRCGEGGGSARDHAHTATAPLSSQPQPNGSAAGAESRASVEIIHGACEPVLRARASGSVACIVTSPPYNMDREYEVRTSLHAYVSWLADVVQEMGRVLALHGSLWLQVGNYCRDGAVWPLDSMILPAIWKAGLTLRNRVIWVHDHGTHATKRLSPRHEAILWATKGAAHFDLDPIRVPQKWPGKKHFKGPKKGQLSCNPLGKNPGDVWTITQVKNNHPEKTAHPCQFPEELVRRCVLSTTKPGDLVMDPFAGSGTVGRVCADTGRRALLIERDEKYVEIARRRIAA